MPVLDVPGATLHYDTFGQGPLLLFVTGAHGRGSVFHTIADLLSSSYTVICWDRRGYSQSFLRGDQDFADRLNTDADDAAKLIQHVAKTTDQGPLATVFGTSSGAIVATALLIRHPQLISKLLAHEPPAFSVLPHPSKDRAKGLVNHVYDVYRAKGPIAAMNTFTGALSEGKDAKAMRECMNPERSDEIRANSLFWFEFELRQYPCAEFDVPAVADQAAKYWPVAGITSGDGPGVGPIAVIARVVGKEILRMPGGHIGYVTDPQEWAESLRSILRA